MKKDFDTKKTVKFEDLPTVNKVIDRIKTHDGIKTYQEAEVKKYDMSLSFYQAKCEEYMDLIQTWLRNRIKIQHAEFLDNTLTILATKFNGWEKCEMLRLDTYPYTTYAPAFKCHKKLLV